MKDFLWNADLGDGTYQNPILYTDYSDPDVVRVGDDFYLVAASFCNTHGLPVLHSRDLISWKLISYVLERIEEPGYDSPRHGCGVWAPSIRHHNGLFYVYYPMPDEGIFLSTAKHPSGPWSKPLCVVRGKGLIDPCPLWDEDGSAYLVYAYAKSRSGKKSLLHVSPLRPDGTALLGEGIDVFDGHNTQPTIEGPKFYKRNGWYYILAPAGSVKSGWQTALRSRNVYGPYEEKIVLMQGDSPVNGPHQGGWVDTPDGTEHWFVHFQDVGVAGRILHLQPLRWENDWPVIGADEGEGYGTPVHIWKKPALPQVIPPCSPATSDDFSGSALSLCWQWNANGQKAWYRLENPGLRLLALPYAGALCDNPRLLLQKWTAPAFTLRAQMDLSDLREGDQAGLISFGRSYTALAVEKTASALRLVWIAGEIGGDEHQTILASAPLSSCIRLGFAVCLDETGQFYLKTEETEAWQPAGERFVCTPGVWVGAKFGFFALHRGTDEGGSLKLLRVRLDTDCPFPS